MRRRARGQALAIAGANLRRTFRDRAGLFFILVLPVVIIIVIGSTFGTGATAFDVGLVNADGSSPLAREMVERLADSPVLDVRRFPDEGDLRQAVRRDELEAAWWCRPATTGLSEEARARPSPSWPSPSPTPPPPFDRP